LVNVSLQYNIRIAYGPANVLRQYKLRNTQYNKFDNEVPSFAIPKDPQNVDRITFQKPKRWEDI
jgi:hypothetical protein